MDTIVIPSSKMFEKWNAAKQTLPFESTSPLIDAHCLLFFKISFMQVYSPRQALVAKNDHRRRCVQPLKMVFGIVKDNKPP
jgi:hypothetical protein